MSRPKTINEWQTRLAAGEKFVIIDSAAKQTLHLEKIAAPYFDTNGIYRILVNDRVLFGSLVFIQGSCLHKVDTLNGISTTNDLFFEEIQFI